MAPLSANKHIAIGSMKHINIEVAPLSANKHIAIGSMKQINIAIGRNARHVEVLLAN